VELEGAISEVLEAPELEVNELLGELLVAELAGLGESATVGSGPAWPPHPATRTVTATVVPTTALMER
jgi:hypothetical protein